MLVCCSAACVIDSLGDCSVAQSPLIVGISGIFNLGSRLHAKTCVLL